MKKFILSTILLLFMSMNLYGADTYINGIKKNTFVDITVAKGITFGDGTVITSTATLGGGGTTTTLPYHNIDIGYACFPSTNACSLNQHTVTDWLAPNYELAFDKNIDESCFWQQRVTSDWDTNPVIEISWVANTASGQVVWGVYTSTMDSASTSFMASTTTVSFAYAVSSSNAESLNTSTYTVTGLWKNNDYLNLGLFRSTKDTNDTMADDARIIAIRFYEP